MGPEDQHPWDREDEEIARAFAAKDAEIARLTGDLRITIAVCNENTDLKKLIIELVEAIRYCHVYRISDSTIAEHRELMQRAREATQ